METQHTPTPWKIQAGSDLHGRLALVHETENAKSIVAVVAHSDAIADEHGGDVVDNAIFIVRAVNSHDALLEAAKLAVTILGRVRASGEDIGPDVCKAQFALIRRGLENAIAKAEGKL